jgi:hypothetical protein
MSSPRKHHMGYLQSEGLNIKLIFFPMHFLAGKPYSPHLMQNCLVLNTLKSYMLQTTNFVRNIELVRKSPLVSSLGLMDSYFEKINYACLTIL